MFSIIYIVCDYSLRYSVECAPGGSHRVVLQRIQDQVCGRHEGSGSCFGGNRQLVVEPSNVGRTPVQSRTICSDQKHFRSRPYGRRYPTGI